jgi:SAM-dependent methyltransferase
MNAEQIIPTDQVGFSTLLSISDIDKFNQWMFESIRPYIKGKTLEVGSGIGNISAMLVRSHLPLTLSDYSKEYSGFLQKRFASEPLIEGVYRIDLSAPDFEITWSRLFGSFDTVFALNVIEHIEDDQLAVANCHKLLAPGGRLILLMPAYQSLYNRFDKGLGHCRRYTRQTMSGLLSTRFEVVRTWHFNLAGIFGWFFFGAVLRGKTITKGQMNIYNRLVWLFRITDKLTLRRIGLSVIGVGKKK